MDSSLTVLGSCGAWPEAGRACNGFLLEHDGFRVLLDLGYATLPRLLDALGSHHAAGLDAVVVTHAHSDHMQDLHGLFRARLFGPHLELPVLPLFAPRAVLDTVTCVEHDDPGTIPRVFEWNELPAEPYDVGPFKLSSRPLPHFIPNAGVRLSAAGVTVAYTGDTGPDPALIELAHAADLFIAEASDRDQQPETPPAPPGEPKHLNAYQAGMAAAEAAAHRLLLTHFWPGNDREASRAAASALFDGEILTAEEGMRIQLP